MDLMKFVKRNETPISVLFSIIVIGYLTARWIQDNYYLLEYLSVVLIFGIIYEAWQGFQPEGSKHDFIRAFGLDNPTGMQVSLLWIVGSTVGISIILRNWVEGYFGPLSVVQMLGVIVVLSRVYVNVYLRGEIDGILDGEPSSYTAYSAGIIAFFLSLQLRTYYPVTSFRHNIVVICVSVVIPYVLFYETELRHSLLDTRKSSSD